MTIQPILSASPAIQVHVFAACVAILVGLLQLAFPKGTGVHRWTGWFWIILMAVVALSSFFIHTIRLVGPWSPIHLLSIYTLVMLWAGIRAGRKGKTKEHAYTMMSIFVFALIGAGAFTLLPGRIMHVVLFGA
ncbi:DUF2306 domain-containing protein [Marinobacter sp. ATCH36]|uniref:DUF2306 domain-containing protein n=1 Tax=Marinobacter sp. ATCH36 TaxID=2945106 RepID=UPI002020A3DC|nr:DUF2306 domain-containing protein [Marinobacter sp. ATCH36]MCL7943780.1 DUF2306 domain-containing protein [Marinobacter sp. ATCH36]